MNKELDFLNMLLEILETDEDEFWNQGFVYLEKTGKSKTYLLNFIREIVEERKKAFIY
jgi:hypothetical protein